MTGNPLHINSEADLAQAIIVAEASGALGFAHLARALAKGRIAFQPILVDTSAGRFKQFARLTAGRPAVTSIGDDDGFDRGPDGWALARRAIAWARAIMVHGAGAEIIHYEAAIVAARITNRCLIIECSSATLDAWISRVAAAPHRPKSMIIRCRDGGVHPLPVERGAMH